MEDMIKDEAKELLQGFIDRADHITNAALWACIAGLEESIDEILEELEEPEKGGLLGFIDEMLQHTIGIALEAKLAMEAGRRDAEKRSEVVEAIRHSLISLSRIGPAAMVVTAKHAEKTANKSVGD